MLSVRKQLSQILTKVTQTEHALKNCLRMLSKRKKFAYACEYAIKILLCMLSVGKKFVKYNIFKKPQKYKEA